MFHTYKKVARMQRILIYPFLRSTKVRVLSGKQGR